MLVQNFLIWRVQNRRVRNRTRRIRNSPLRPLIHARSAKNRHAFPHLPCLSSTTLRSSPPPPHLLTPLWLTRLLPHLSLSVSLVHPHPLSLLFRFPLPTHQFPHPISANRAQFFIIHRCPESLQKALLPRAQNRSYKKPQKKGSVPQNLLRPHSQPFPQGHRTPHCPLSLRSPFPRRPKDLRSPRRMCNLWRKCGC